MIDLVEPVVCYRWWSVTGSGELRSATATSHAWKPGVNLAVCVPPFNHIRGCGKTVPSASCGCGLHAFVRSPPVTPSQLVKDCPNELPFRLIQAMSGGLPVVVVGAVLLWGRMLSGGSCVRASHGEVLALTGVHAFVPAKFYGVPAVKADMLRAVALEHGSELPEETVAQLEAETGNRHTVSPVVSYPLLSPATHVHPGVTATPPAPRTASEIAKDVLLKYRYGLGL